MTIESDSDAGYFGYNAFTIEQVKTFYSFQCNVSQIPLQVDTELVKMFTVASGFASIIKAYVDAKVKNGMIMHICTTNYRLHLNVAAMITEICFVRYAHLCNATSLSHLLCKI